MPVTIPATSPWSTAHLEAVDGVVVLALLGGEFTIKRYCCRGNRCWLHAENPAYPDIEIGEDSGFEVWGVVTKGIRMLT